MNIAIGKVVNGYVLTVGRPQADGSTKAEVRIAADELDVVREVAAALGVELPSLGPKVMAS